MQDCKVRLCIFQLLSIKNVCILQSDIIRLVEETFLLYSCHIKHIQLAHHFFHRLYFFIWNILCFEHFGNNVFRHAEFLRCNQDEFDVLITGQCLDQGMYGTSKLQIATQTNREIIQSSFLPQDCKQVCQCLCRMVMSAIPRIDNRHATHHGSTHRRAFLRMTHCDDICIAAYHSCCIAHALALRC